MQAHKRRRGDGHCQAIEKSRVRACVCVSLRERLLVRPRARACADPKQCLSHSGVDPKQCLPLSSWSPSESSVAQWGGNHFRSREELLEGHARPVPLPHESMQTLGPLQTWAHIPMQIPGITSDHAKSSWRDMLAPFPCHTIPCSMLAPFPCHTIPYRPWDHLGSRQDHAKTTSHHGKTCNRFS